MSDAAEQKVAELERELKGSQEILFGVLMAIGEPVEVSIEALKDMISQQAHVINVNLDTERNVAICTLERIDLGV